MNPTQKATLKAFIVADQTLSAFPMNSDGDFEIAKLINLGVSPSFTVWRTNVTRAELYHQVSAEATSWNWTTYKSQTQSEQGAWTQMFMGDQANFALPNLRSAIENIFGVNNAQTTHCKAIGKRNATVFEKIFATGTGTIASPATMVLESPVSPQDVGEARNS